jgi:PAB1-binding protein PBP1
MNKDNNANVQIYYLCNDTDSEKDNKCKKLIEMANVIVLNKLLNNPRYINKNNKIAYTILNDNIYRSTNKLKLREMTKEEMEEYENKNYVVVVSELDEYMNNLANNGVDTQGQGMDQGQGMYMQNMSHMPSHMPTNMPTHMPHIPKGGNISKRKSYKKLQHQ